MAHKNLKIGEISKKQSLIGGKSDRVCSTGDSRDMMSYPELSVVCQALHNVSQDMLDLGFLVSYNRDIGILGYESTQK